MNARFSGPSGTTSLVTDRTIAMRFEVEFRLYMTALAARLSTSSTQANASAKVLSSSVQRSRIVPKALANSGFASKGM